MQAGVSLLILDVIPIYWSLPGYHHNYLRLYQLPNSNLFTHRMLFFSREATSEIYGPGSLLYHICLRDLFLSAFIFRSINPKIQKYLGAIYYYLFYLAFPRDLFIQSTTILSIFSPRRDWQPLFHVGCKYLFFVCMYHLQSVVWFSYWSDNLGLTLREIPTVVVLHHPFLFGEMPTQI